MVRSDFKSYEVADQAELVRTPTPSFLAGQDKVFQRCGGCEVGVLRGPFAIHEEPDGNPIDVRRARVWGAVGMESASHAHVPEEAAPQREAAQLNARLARVSRIGIPDELGDEGLLALPGGLFPNQAVNPGVVPI